MPDTASHSADDARPGNDLAALRAEIDALDDAIHDLLMRRAEVVARLAASRTKGNGPAIRPGREAIILRRLLGRHRGALPRAALVRLWRELLGATTGMQAPLTVAASLPDAGIEVLRTHLGLATAVTRLPGAAEALSACEAGRTALAALPPEGRWWRELSSSRLFVTARLPFFGNAGATVFLLSPTPPDPSGEDRSLLRLPSGREAELASAGLPPAVLAREEGIVLAEIPGMLAPGDSRLAASGATLLGAYATPVTA
jgi:chorismate mutase/prephenate dehydratase